MIPDDELILKLASQQWTSHNLKLSDKITTMPGKPDFMETETRLHAVTRLLDFFYGKGWKSLRVADLGCLEGGFSLALAQRGAEVVGIEARAKNLEKCLLLREHFGLENLSFVKDDVKNFTRETYGEFDVILALGILYHLDNPVEWLKQIAEASKRLLIIDSHYAPDDDHGLRLMSPELSKNLGPLVTRKVNGLEYRGRWYEEYCGKEPWNSYREGFLWASYSNTKSFWLTKESLLTSILNAGFGLFLEQHDGYGPLFNMYTKERSRAMFVAVK